MTIKLLALDLDGTLLNDHGQLSPENLKALYDLSEKGVHIVPSTGRSLLGIPDCVKTLPFINYAITLNGGIVVNVNTKEVIHSQAFNKNHGLEIWKHVSKYDALVDCAINGEMYMDEKDLIKLNEYAKIPGQEGLKKGLRLSTESMELFLKQEETTLTKINLWFLDLDKKSKTRKELEEIPSLEVSSSMPNNLEINTLGANKGVGLGVLKDHLGVKNDEVMAMGDSDNDIAMLKEAGLSIAMANSSEEVLKVADHITLSNIENGVAYAINKWLR